MEKKWLCNCDNCRSQRRLDRHRQRAVNRTVTQVQNNQDFRGNNLSIMSVRNMEM